MCRVSLMCGVQDNSKLSTAEECWVNARALYEEHYAEIGGIAPQGHLLISSWRWMETALQASLEDFSRHSISKNQRIIHPCSKDNYKLL